MFFLEEGTEICTQNGLVDCSLSSVKFSTVEL